MGQAPSRRSTRFSMRSKQLGQLLLENGHVQPDQIATALKKQESGGGLLGQLLQDMGACNEQAIALALLKQVQVTDIQCEDLSVSTAASSLISQSQCLTDKLCPFEKLGNLLCVVMGNPLNRRAINAIEESSRLKVKPFKAPWPKIKSLIDRTYAPGATSRPASDTESYGEQGYDDAPSTADLLGEPLTNDETLPQWESNPDPEVAAHEEPQVDSDTNIKGLDQLDEAYAEVIDEDLRGLTKRHKPTSGDLEEKSQRPPPKKAKVNVDLDTLDLDDATEVIHTPNDDLDENFEEIPSDHSDSDPWSNDEDGTGHERAPEDVQVEVEEDGQDAESLRPDFVPIRIIPDEYFYSADHAPEKDSERPDELLALIQDLPIAEVVDSSTGEFQQELDNASPKEELEETPIELQPIPVDPMLAVSLSEQEYQRMVNSLVLDPIGEWDWKYATSGPIAVEAYEN